MFEEVLARLEADLDIPYPERGLVVAEIAGELEAAYSAHRRSGKSGDEARAAALGYYSVLALWADGRLEGMLLRRALREPLPNLIVAAVLAALVVLLHGAVKAGMRAMRVPATK